MAPPSAPEWPARHCDVTGRGSARGRAGGRGRLCFGTSVCTRRDRACPPLGLAPPPGLRRAAPGRRGRGGLGVAVSGHGAPAAPRAPPPRAPQAPPSGRAPSQPGPSAPPALPRRPVHPALARGCRGERLGAQSRRRLASASGAGVRTTTFAVAPPGLLYCCFPLPASDGGELLRLAAAMWR